MDLLQKIKEAHLGTGEMITVNIGGEPTQFFICLPSADVQAALRERSRLEAIDAIKGYSEAENEYQDSIDIEVRTKIDSLGFSSKKEDFEEAQRLEKQLKIQRQIRVSNQIFTNLLIPSSIRNEKREPITYKYGEKTIHEGMEKTGIIWDRDAEISLANLARTNDEFADKLTEAIKKQNPQKEDEVEAAPLDTGSN